MYLTEYEQLIPKANEMSKRTREFASAFYSKCNRQSLGNVSEEFFKCSPTSMRQWFNYYTVNVRTCEEIYELCEYIHHQSALQSSVEELYHYYIWEVIINAYNGFKKELDIMADLQAQGHKVEHSTQEQDAEYGIDLIVDDKYFIQIKPISFIRGNNNASLINDRKLAIFKQEKAMKDYGKPTFFIFYDRKTSKTITTNGKLCHKLSDYINSDGTTINNRTNM